ncbi:MAG: TIGR01777 family oxidoreductase [Raineya sp.]
MKEKVLITGGTGLVGKRLCQILLQEGYQVSFLSRSKKNIPNVEVFQWDIYKGSIEQEAINTADYVVHLAGAGVAEHRWTESYKKEILESRLLSTQLLYKSIQNAPQKPKAFLAASAVGIYGFDSGTNLLDENSPQGTDFLAEVTKNWEKETSTIKELGIRTSIFRIGIVLSKEGGALAKMMQPIEFFVGAALGSGKQYMSWIHIEDLARMFLFGIKNPQIEGVFNAVGNMPATNAEFTKTLAKILKKPLFLPNIPSFALKIMLGEMSAMVTGGNRISNKKILEAGFKYKFNTLEEALEDLLQKA